MTGSARLGIGIAALFALGVFAVYLFGNHDSWFVRAAQDNAVHCLTTPACPRLTLQGPIVTMATPPLAKTSACANSANWHELKSAAGPLRVLVTCRDGATYFYHMGRTSNPATGDEQWMECETPDCKAEAKMFAAN